ncbi:MAG: GNAT family N-acetyltransferase [Planctomycetes bacterium]|nr:GNAT family N-acetyltransferase [Planctomycetota bacterium]
MMAESAEPGAVEKIPVSEVEVRNFEKSDLAQLPELLHRCLGRQVTESWLDWKFFQLPYQGKLAFVVATHSDELVGFIGANPVPFSVEGELSRVYQHQDIAIDERCRGLQLLRSMIQRCEDEQAGMDNDFTYSITTPHLRALVTKRMKYTVVWENLKMVKLTSLKAVASKATRSSMLASLMPGPIARSSWKAPASMSGEMVALEEFGPEFEDFWKKSNVANDAVGRIFPWQDPAWLNYKFFGDEMVKFHCFGYREAGEFLGYVVVNFTRLDVRIGYIEAMWTVPDRPDVVDLLTDFGVSQCLQNKCDQISCWTRPDAPLGQALGSRGFTRRPTPQCLSIKQLRDGMGDLGLKGEHWNLQRGHTYYTSLGHLSVDDGQTRLAKVKEQKVKDRKSGGG